jgi:hypothetical protein
MDALEVETSIAEGAQALQVLMPFARESAGTLEAHEAEQGIFTRLLPMGLAAMQRSFAQRGTGDLGAAITCEDGVLLPREKSLRGRDDCSLFGTFAVARTCDRTPGEPGIFPLDAQVNFPERCDSSFRQAWMTVFEVEHPFKERARWFEPLFDLEVAESVLMEVAQEAPVDDEGFYAQRPVPPEEPAGLPVGTGVVELTCGSVVKHRMEGEGKRWSLAGAEAMLALRSLKKSHDHDLRA